jgi:Fungal specific transcription factor domain
VLDDKFFIMNSLALNHDWKVLKIAAVDPTWLHSTFSLVARSFDFQRGAAQTPSTECLYYRGEALSRVNKELTSSREISAPVIGAVASLCNFDTFNADLSSATKHMAGLERLVALQGGIQNLKVSHDFLKKLVSW